MSTKDYKIIYEPFGKYAARLYPVSYFSPLENLQQLSEELKKNLPAGSFVLFDLLLCNGENTNRFAEIRFMGDVLRELDLDYAELTSEELQFLNRYYSGKVEELNKGILTKKQIYKYATYN